MYGLNTSLGATPLAVSDRSVGADGPIERKYKGVRIVFTYIIILGVRQ